MEEIRALARALVALHGVDALRARAGRTDAIRVLRLSGADVEQIAGNWSEAERPVQQSSSTTLSMFGEDPRHAPEVTTAILAGRPMTEISAIIARITSDQEQAKLDGTGRLSVKEANDRMLARQRAEDQEHEAQMRAAGYVRSLQGWTKAQPLYADHDAGSA
jgi:hypothetical protein